MRIRLGIFLAILSMAAAGQTSNPARVPRAGAPPAPAPATSSAVAHPSPSPTPTPPRANPASLAPPSIVTGPKYSPAQLDFGIVEYSGSSKRTFSLTSALAGEITLEFPTGSFVLANAQLVPPINLGANPSQVQHAMVPPGKPVPVSSNGQTEVYKWSVVAGEEIRLEILFAPMFSKNKNPGTRTASMNFGGPGTIRPWAVSVPMRGMVNLADLTSDSPQKGLTGAHNVASTGSVSRAGAASAAPEPSLEQLKLRLSSIQGLKVRSTARIQNPGSNVSVNPGPSQNPGSRLSISPGPVQNHGSSVSTNPGPVQNPSSRQKQVHSNGATPAMKSGMSQNPGQADPTATLSTASAAVGPCPSLSQKDPTLLAIDGQPNQWVFSNEPHIYHLTGCNFGSPQRLLQLHFTDPSSGWTEDLPLHASTWGSQEIAAAITFEVQGGKLVPMPDVGSLELRLIHESIPGKYWVLGKGKFRAVRGNPVPLTAIPKPLIAPFAQGSPYLLVPMTNFYGVNGAMGVVRPSLNSLVPLGQDKVKLALKSGFIIDSAQLEYLLYDNQGQGSTQTADSSRLTINGNNILINYPIDSITQNGQTSYYSIYGLKVWVVGPKDIDPWQ